MAEWSTPVNGNVYGSISSYDGDGIINSSASANVKGGWEVIKTSVSFTSNMIELVAGAGVGVSRDMLMDIGIGGAGSEQVLVSNLLISLNATSKASVVRLPLHVPVGSRLSARIQATTGSTGVEVFGRAFPQMGEQGAIRVETLGANTADSGGTSIDPGGTIGVWGSYVQMTASTSFAYKWVCFALGNQNNTARTSMAADLDLAIGAGGSEQLILGNSFRFVANATDDFILPQFYGPYPVSLAAGTRIAARAINWSTTDATDRLVDLVVYGMG